MRKPRFTESQIVAILKQGEAGVPIAEILRQHNISKATYFHWRAKCAGASVDELKRLNANDLGASWNKLCFQFVDKTVLHRLLCGERYTFCEI